MASGDDVARAATRRDDLRRRLRGTRGRGRKLRGLVLLLAPYRVRVALMGVALVAGTAASLAPAPLAKTAIDSGKTAVKPAAQCLLLQYRALGVSENPLNGGTCRRLAQPARVEGRLRGWLSM